MTRPSRAEIVGLVLALGGPALLAVVAEAWVGGSAPDIGESVAAQLAMWALAAAVVAIALGWERRPLSSLGVRAPGIATILWGLLAAALLIEAVVPIALRVVSLIGWAAFDEGLSRVFRLPIWLRVVAVVTGGITEELFYRGYAITRLERVTGSPLLAAFFLWRRDRWPTSWHTWRSTRWGWSSRPLRRDRDASAAIRVTVRSGRWSTT